MSIIGRNDVDPKASNLASGGVSGLCCRRTVRAGSGAKVRAGAFTFALCTALTFPAILSAQSGESESSLPPAGEENAPSVELTSLPNPVRPDEPVDLAVELLLTEHDSDTGVSIFAKRPLQTPEPLTPAQLNAINPHSKDDEIAIPLRGYPAPDQPPVPNRPLYAEGTLGLHLTTDLRAGFSGDTWPFDYHAALEYESTDGFVENGERSGFSVEAGGGYVIGLDYGIFSGGYMGGDAHYKRRSYRLYALQDAPERSMLDWGLEATGTASFAGIDFEGTGRVSRASLNDASSTEAGVGTRTTDELGETSVEGQLTAEMKALGLGWHGKLDMRLTGTTPGSVNYGALDLSAVFDIPLFSVRGGGELSLAGASDGENFTRFAPDVELRVHPFNGVVVSGRLSGGLHQTTVHGLAELNPYVSLNGPLMPEDERLGYEVALNLEPGSRWGLRVGASRRSFDSYLYFDAPEEGRFTPNYDNADVDLINGDFYWKLDSRNELLMLTRYTVGSVGDSLSDLPYMPRWDAEIGYTRRLLSSPITLGGTLRYVGERQGGTERLDPAFLLGFEGSYSVLRYLDLVLEARNILDQNYRLWDGYRERGFYIGVGARGHF